MGVLSCLSTARMAVVRFVLFVNRTAPDSLQAGTNSVRLYLVHSGSRMQS